MATATHYFQEFLIKPDPSTTTKYEGRFVRLGFELENFYNINWESSSPYVEIDGKKFLINRETGILEFDDLDAGSFTVDNNIYIVEALVKGE